MLDSAEISSQAEQSFSASVSQEKFIQDIRMTNEKSKDKETKQENPTIRELNKSEDQKFAELTSAEKEMELTRELMKYSAFRPVVEVEVEDRKFLLSRVIKGDGSQRDQIFMYYHSEKFDKLYPRILYKSKSDGGWRSCPGSDGFGHYSKGKGIHYTQETKPHEDLIKAIEVVENKFPVKGNGHDFLEYYFDFTTNPDNMPEWLTYGPETRQFDDGGTLTEFQQFPPGDYDLDHFKDIDFSAAFNQFNFNKPGLEKFLPNFIETPLRTMQVEHTLLGPTTEEVFPAELQGRPIEWVMAYDKQGRVWVDRIAPVDAKINSYGVRSDVIDSGALTNKPLDYKFQVTALKDGLEKIEFEENTQYKDITPLLDNLRPIKEFRAARGVTRTESITEDSIQLSNPAA